MRTTRTLLPCAFLLICVVAGFAQPSLQVTGYRVIPDVVYPGTIGYIQLDVKNTGDDAATAVSATYMYGGWQNTLTTGELSAGSTTQITIPFSVPENAKSGITLRTIDIYYSYSDGGGSASKRTTYTVPIFVSQIDPLEVRTLSHNVAITAGERANIAIELRNKGGVINNLVITMPANSSFAFEGVSQYSLGNIPYNSTKIVNITLRSTPDTATGTYNIPLLFSYLDANNQRINQTLFIGPICVMETSAQYRISLHPLTPVEVGSTALFHISIKNMGQETVSGFIDINNTDVFTPIGSQRIYFDSIPPGGSFTTNLTIGIAATKEAGYYPLPIKLTPSSGSPIFFTVGIEVDATPEITVSLTTKNSRPSVQIVNTGNCQIRSVYAKAYVKGTSTRTEDFIGTLAVDDYSTLFLDAIPYPGQTVVVEISFRDTNNIKHTIREELQVGTSAIYAGIRQQTGGIPQAGINRSFARTPDPLRMLLGPTAGEPTATNPLSLGLIIVLVGGIAVVIYFAYRRWRGKANATK
ncbi:MAG: hypothetical protein QXP42_02740 [Candidatus Micrarchaeia archaeon]